MVAFLIFRDKALVYNSLSGVIGNERIIAIESEKVKMWKREKVQIPL